MLCPYLLISINELLISIISFNDINKYGLNVKTAAHSNMLVGVIEPLNCYRYLYYGALRALCGRSAGVPLHIQSSGNSSTLIIVVQQHS